MHEVIMGQSEVGINVDLDPETPWWQTLLKILAAVAVGIAAIALFIFAPGVLAAIWTAIKAIGTFLAATGLTSVLVVGGVVMAASSILASRIYRQYVFATIFVFSRRNF